MTSPVRLQMNAVRRIGQSTPRREVSVAQDGIGVGRVNRVPVLGSVTTSRSSTQRDPNERPLVFGAKPKADSAARGAGAGRDPASSPTAASEGLDAASAVPFVELQRAVSGQSVIPGPLPFSSTASTAPGAPDVAADGGEDASPVEDLFQRPEYEDPFLAVRQQLQPDDAESTADEEAAEIFARPKEPPKPFGRQIPFDPKALPDADEAQRLSGEPFALDLRPAPDATVDAARDTSLQLPTPDRSVATAVLRGAVVAGLSGLTNPHLLDDPSDSPSVPVLGPLNGDTANRQTPTATPRVAATVHANPSATPDNGVLSKSDPLAELASYKYRAAEQHDYASTLTVPKSSESSSGRWSRIGAMRPTLVFSLTS